jgi:lysyl-tRNA synthetase class 1
MEEKKFQDVHWADNAAQKVIDTFPNEEEYVVASGVTPSGIIHAGHFREIITTELVRRSLEKKGKKTKFIYSWDSYDVFRKVPKNIPNPEEYKKNLRLPDGIMPDPWNCHESFGEHFMQIAEKELEKFKFPIIFQRQHLIQTSGIYAEGIKKYLNKREEIRKILNKFRSEPLEENWFPLILYCEKCGKDTTTLSDYDEEYTISYKCECGNKNRINFKETPIVKLPWRLDWPMRWDYYKVSFEPGGKDHSSPGSSYDTGKEIIQLVSNRKAPVYVFYNFIGMKGIGGKISSSTGTGATLQDLTKVYTPEIIIYLFASTRPQAEFSISFDLDIIKIYEDFDKLERLYYGLEDEKNPKKKATLERIYELSIVGNREIPKEIPFQPSFRHLLNVSQANDFNFEKVQEFFNNEIKTEFDLERLKERFEAAKNWLELYAPEDMIFKIKTEISIDNKELNQNILNAIYELREIITKKDIKDSKELMSYFKEICEKNSIIPKDLFQTLYKIIIGKEKGPRLANLIIENKEKVLNLLNKL